MYYFEYISFNHEKKMKVNVMSCGSCRQKAEKVLQGRE